MPSRNNVERLTAVMRKQQPQRFVLQVVFDQLLIFGRVFDYQYDVAAVKASLPHGEVTIEVTPGGMLVPNGLDDGGRICVVNAAVEVVVAT